MSSRKNRIRQLLDIYFYEDVYEIIISYEIINIDELNDNMKKEFIVSILPHITYIEIINDTLFLYQNEKIASIDCKLNLQFNLQSNLQLSPVILSSNLNERLFTLRLHNKNIFNSLIKVFDVLSVYDDTYRFDGKNQCFLTNYFTISNKKYNGVVVYYIRKNVIYKWIVQAGQFSLLGDRNVLNENYNRKCANYYSSHCIWDFE